MHWVLDVTFREDDSRSRERTLGDTLAGCVAVSLLKRHPGQRQHSWQNAPLRLRHGLSPKSQHSTRFGYALAVVANGIVTGALSRGPWPVQGPSRQRIVPARARGTPTGNRCREADVPDEVRYRSKWQIGLELLARTERNGWRFDWLTFDEWYGGKPGFLRVLDLAGLRYVGEVPKSFSCRAGTKPDCSA